MSDEASAHDSERLRVVYDLACDHDQDAFANLRHDRQTARRRGAARRRQIEQLHPVAVGRGKREQLAVRRQIGGDDVRALERRRQRARRAAGGTERRRRIRNI